MKIKNLTIILSVILIFIITLGAVSADPLNNEISNESPLGKAIFKAKKGQRVTVLTEDNDRFEVKIIDIKLPKKETKKKNEK